ncbi:MAG: DUF116 domain-containing protein [Firmicutes bacterium]|nr:DUF116 domain-containing protein [Bacillota bacterium]
METRVIMQKEVHKRLFLGLVGASLVGFLFLFFGLWYIIFHPANSAFYNTILIAILLVVLGGILLAIFGIIGLIFTLLAARNLPFLQAPIQLALRFFYPIALALGHLLSIDKDRIRRSFVEVNNQLVRTKGIKIAPHQILVLVPHCLQWTGCPHKITIDVHNCRRCGKCYVNDLLALRERYGVNLGVATGGTLARKYVEEYRPKAIVAIACERDLSSGIQDVGYLPVLGVPNERPNGPCHDTCIKIERVEEAIRHFLG